jgi:hypothetical protein
MASLLDSLTSSVASAAGIKFSDGQIVLSEDQILAAQNMVRKILSSSKGSGKSVSGMYQNFRIVGLPVLEKYGIYIGLGFSAFIAAGVFLGYKVGRE